MDQSKKTMRHFYCRDVLWETFEQMANDFDCSIDYLINEAMRFYARSKNYQAGAAPASPSSPNVAPPPNGPMVAARPAASTRPPMPPPAPSAAMSARAPVMPSSPPAQPVSRAPRPTPAPP